MIKTHPSTYFKVYVTNGFSTLGNATHESTTWIIEDIAGASCGLVLMIKKIY